MESIRIENLRCFKDTGEIKLLPLNIAVGKNSCGKSTILRTFPLFKQTLEAKVSEPILWYGRYVDFGDFKQSINKIYSEREIEFQFKFNCYLGRMEEAETLLVFKIIDGNISNVGIKSHRDEINIDYGINGSVKKIKINNTIINSKGDKFRYTERELIPNIYNETDELKYTNNSFIFFNSRKDIESKDELLTKLREIIEKKLISNSSLIMERIRDFFVESLPSINEIEYGVKKIVNEIKFHTLPLSLDPYEETNYNTEDHDEFELNENQTETLKIVEELKENYGIIYNLSLAKNLNYIISNCNSYLYTYFTNVTYIAPLRATAERYYRIQGLAIDDIDSRGENVPMILKNMRDKERQAFEKWMLNRFDISITTDSSEGHISLFIVKDGKRINMADTGFGYSQILPIIVLLWKNLQKKNHVNNWNTFDRFNTENIKKLIVIEQPELHLHPKMQAQLMDVILEILRETDKVNFLIETHSQTIIDHIGRRIEDNEIDPKNVNVLLVEQREDDLSDVRCVSYSSEGYLKEWPIDFFAGDEW
jgi:predicted ATPase